MRRSPHRCWPMGFGCVRRPANVKLSRHTAVTHRADHVPRQPPLLNRPEQVQGRDPKTTKHDRPQPGPAMRTATVKIWLNLFFILQHGHRVVKPILKTIKKLSQKENKPVFRHWCLLYSRLNFNLNFGSSVRASWS